MTTVPRGATSGRRWVRKVEAPRFLTDSGEHVQEGRGGLGAVPGSDRPVGGEALVDASSVPEQDQIVGDAGDRGGACDGRGGLVLGILEAEELLLVVEGDLDGPPPSIAFEDEGVIDG